jgi:hypothetical protein
MDPRPDLGIVYRRSTLVAQGSGSDAEPEIDVNAMNAIVSNGRGCDSTFPENIIKVGYMVQTGFFIR